MARSSPAERTRLTVDELARTSGMTVRNIRAHQARGLLPPPEVRGRTGYYGQDHLDRVQLIRDLQAEGLNLSAIKRALDETPAGAAGQALSLRRALLEPWEDENPIAVTGDDLLARFGEADPRLLDRALRLGVLVDLGEGLYEVPSPSLLGAAEELVAVGIPLDAVLRVEERVARHSDGIARAFVGLLVDEIWAPFEAAGRPEADWQRVREVVERSRPLALRTAAASLRQSMTRAVERSLAHRMAPSRRRRRRRGRGAAAD